MPVAGTQGCGVVAAIAGAGRGGDAEYGSRDCAGRTLWRIGVAWEDDLHLDREGFGQGVEKIVVGVVGLWLRLRRYGQKI
jgi:hypothetical protein